MGAIFSRIKNWNAENLTNEDLNAEIDNILDNFEPAQMDDYSTNVAAMQTKTDPGEVGSESLATTLAGELERLRFCIGEIKGTSQWYESSSTSLLEIAGVLGGGLEANRISSGRSSANSSQPIYLVPAGATNGRTVDIKGATTNLVYNIEGISYTISTDVSSGTLLAAPSSNNTALVNDAFINDQEISKNLGEYGTEITIDTVGSEISSRVGEWAAFKVNNGVDDEYFLAYVKDSTTLSKIRRGYFFDETDAGIPRVAIANNDTITLMKLTWVFVNTARAIVVTYNNPKVSATEPSSPGTGDYWFDLANDKWKTFNSSVYVDADATFVGICIQDTTDTVGARSLDVFKDHTDENTIKLVAESATEVRGTDLEQEIKVYGSIVRFRQDFPRWSMTTDLESGVSEAASTTYYFYVTEDGGVKISDKMPLDRRADLRGLYHPFEAWRCVGQASNDASQDLEAVLSYHDESEQAYAVTTSVAASALTIKVHGTPVHKFKFRADGSDPQSDYGETVLLSPQSITVPSGATLDHTASQEEPIHLYGIMNGANPELAVCTSAPYTNIAQTTVAIGAGADNAELYSDVVRTDVSIFDLAGMQSNQTVAGTWAADVDYIALVPYEKKSHVKLTASSGAASTTSTTYSTIANQSIVYYSHGRPLHMEFISDANGSPAMMGMGDNTASSSVLAFFRILDSTNTVEINTGGMQYTSQAGNVYCPASAMNTIYHVDPDNTGFITIVVQFKVSTTNDLARWENVKLRAWEDPNG